jgi:hypothetical protein
MGHYRGPVIPPCIGTGVQVCLTVAGPLTSGTWPAGPELLLSIRTLPYSSSCIAPVQLAYHVTVFITVVCAKVVPGRAAAAVCFIHLSGKPG